MASILFVRGTRGKGRNGKSCDKAEWKLQMKGFTG